MIHAIAMSILLIAALVAFALIMKTKFLVLLKAKPEVRWDRVPERIGSMFKVAFAQAKLFKEPGPGLMHALIFWGFLVLLVRSISVIGRAYGADFNSWNLFWFSDSLGGIYNYLKDWTELVVLSMILWAWWRRMITKPKRLTISGAAYLVLSFIGGLMITDFLYDGARFAMIPALQAPETGLNLSKEILDAIKHEASMAPIGSFVATWFSGMSFGVLNVIQETMYWAHVVILLVFLNELPRGKHFHVIVAIPNTFFAKLGAPGAIKAIENIEEQESFGVIEPRDLTWKQIFDGYTCTECGRCTVTCPAVTTDKPLSPKMLICDMRDFIKAHEADILAGKDTVNAEIAPPDMENGQFKIAAHEAGNLIDAIGEEMIWECTTCRSCEENCPVMITHTDKIIEFRRYMTLMEGRMNPELATAQKNLENKSNPWGLPSGERGLWAVEELEAPLLSDKGSAEYLFYMGCSAAYDDRNKKVAVAFIRLLKAAGIDFAILGPEEGCCGDPARRTGNEYLFQAQAQTNIEVFNSYGVKKVITMCPHGYNTIRHEYKQFGGDYEVVHHTELLAQLLKEGKLKPEKEEKGGVVYHDSCYLGRYNDIYDAPREILQAIPGVELKEAEKTRENAMCCGAGGGMMFREEHHGSRINRTRVTQLEGAGAPTIATACPFCLVMSKDGIAELDKEESLKAYDVVELLAKSCNV